ncbi:uncharacterized protein LOC131946963 [Physella acuta]|uniref:uncharacterized protein LOC131946963 n=1 Tax=Physella acuta TaxID=109671 RepID=UPI0027DD0BEE|nr:uncharacterized protein LOC131946963 [Physella acuta]XP_059164008.1 uncharacterized protein LOC131946963 [Physella acuta]XP_059164009.1 uncharacterized protein LOC131946963 [Physella acuta]
MFVPRICSCLLLCLLTASHLHAAKVVSTFNIDSDPLPSVLTKDEVTKVKLGYTLAEGDCPCSNPKWCEPIVDVPEKEVFAFSIRNDPSHWARFDWSKLTTVVMFGYLNESLMCLAHSFNVRVVLLGDIDVATFTDPGKRQLWILNQLVLVKNNFLDGINFDFEGEVAANDSTVRDAYTTLVKEASEYFKKELPHSQISVDVAWKPNVDIRYFDYKGLAEYADILFVMAYDEQSQILGECIAGPNSALASASNGLEAYLNGYDKKILANKLVLGVPWYGYIYQCISLVGDKCYIQEVPFRGVNCSDAAGKQFDYGYIYKLLQTMPGNYRWNATSSTPYITVPGTSSAQAYQVQFDNPQSLKLKYDLAASLGLRGVGMWNIDSLEFTDSDIDTKIRSDMFGALPSRESKKIHRTKPNPTGGVCPCSNPAWCEPIKDINRTEVFAFSTVNDDKNWNQFDWSKITTVCMFNYVNISLMCLAHSHNVRVVINGNFDEKTMLDPTLRQQWVATQLQTVKDNFLDGINFDFETGVSPLQKNISNAYTALVKETYLAFKQSLPYSQISIDVIDNAYSTYRAYDYKSLAQYSDFFFIMAYDESGPNHVGPNSYYDQAYNAIKSFVEDGISARKLVLGLPWYGYVYECFILIEELCIHKPGSSNQFSYSTIYYILKNVPNAYRWNSVSLTPFFSYKDSKTNKIYQIQFDDPKSLSLKYKLAASEGIRGVGMWTIDCLDYSNSPDAREMRAAMFGCLPGVEDLKESSEEKDLEPGLIAHKEIDIELSKAPTAKCPCKDESLCEPIKDTTRKEVYFFSISNNASHWSRFDWAKITTICMYNYVNPELMCLAHAHNVRAVALGVVTEVMMITPELRQQWVTQQLQIAKDNFLDGLNFDLEINISPEQTDLRDAYTTLVNETTQAFKRELPYSQISVDVQADAYTVSRSYDYVALSKIVDFLFIMAYDESGFDVVGPNSDVPDTLKGIDHYYQEQITANKLVLGLPWYGYIYQCEKLVGDNCYYNNSNELSANKARQVDYRTIYTLLKARPEKYRWNATAETPYFSYTDLTTNASYQVQFDDPDSLMIKYKLAAELGLRGIGIWTIDFLDYSDTPEGLDMRTSMFNALPYVNPYVVSDAGLIDVDYTAIDEPEFEIDDVNISPYSAEVRAPVYDTDTVAFSDCPCSDPKLCESVKDTDRQEVFAFSISNDENNWKGYDWSKITTICMFKYLNSSLMCLAHSHNVRVVILGEVTKEIMMSPQLRKDWISSQLQIVKTNFLDGLNFDFEGSVSPHEDQIAEAFTSLVKETKEAFTAELPFSQISVDVPFAASLPDRAYDYQGLAQAADFLFIMAYDEQSATTGGNIAGPNAGYSITENGLLSYMMGPGCQISSNKLVLGLPWYGKIYQCTQLVEEQCIFDETSGVEYMNYTEVQDVLETMPDKLRWNSTTSTPYITFQNPETQVRYQVHFDNVLSLTLKHKLVMKYGLKGAGMWTIDYIDFSTTEKGERMRQEMFGVFN